MDLKKKKILLVDDDKNLRDLYADILVQEGYEVEQALDGEQAFYALKKGGFDLVLLDIILPKMDGLNILEKLNHDPPTVPNGPIIVISNLGYETIVDKSLALGAKDCITKSNYTPDQIISKIKQYIS